MLVLVDIATAGKGTIATTSEAKAQKMLPFVHIPITGTEAIANSSEAKA